MKVAQKASEALVGVGRRVERDEPNTVVITVVDVVDFRLVGAHVVFGVDAVRWQRRGRRQGNENNSFEESHRKGWPGRLVR